VSVIWVVIRQWRLADCSLALVYIMKEYIHDNIRYMLTGLIRYRKRIIMTFISNLRAYPPIFVPQVNSYKPR